MERTPLVYRVYDDTDRLIYIGATSNLKQRLDHHRSAAWWWGLAGRVTKVEQPNMECAFIVEHAAIRAERPAFNLLNRRGGSKTYQHRLTDADVDHLRQWYQSRPYRCGSLPLPLRHLIDAMPEAAA